MMRGLKHTQSWPNLSGMSGKNMTLRPLHFAAPKHDISAFLPPEELNPSSLDYSGAALYKVLEWAVIRSNKPRESISHFPAPGPGLSMECFLLCPQPRVPVSAHTLSWVHLSAGTELDYDGSSLFINATITLLNLQRNTLIGNLKLRSNISHAPAKLMLLRNLTN